jgi:GrpB-like predicted nucleotidyltransferase (UPF0157 family)
MGACPEPIVVPHDPAWSTEFAALAAVLQHTLGKLAVAIHHVGSTSIPGIAAKPILDVDVELAPGATVDAASAALAPLGYVSEGDLGIPERYSYRRSSASVPCSKTRSAWQHHHLYVCTHGSAELARHLRFRDRLRQNDTLRREYLDLKAEALRRAVGVRQVYVDEKARLGADFFARVLA